MKRIIYLWLLCNLLLISPQVARGNPLLCVEPPLASQLNWNLAANGMLVVSYDTDRDHRADLHTLRVVVRSYFSKRSAQEISVGNPDHLIFSVNHEPVRYYYIVILHPLFYAIDVNEDGHWDLIYKDPQQDGVNGNEVFYESPSGMFKEDPDSVNPPGSLF